MYAPRDVSRVVDSRGQTVAGIYAAGNRAAVLIRYRATIFQFDAISRSADRAACFVDDHTGNTQVDAFAVAEGGADRAIILNGPRVAGADAIGAAAHGHSGSNRDARKAVVSADGQIYAVIDVAGDRI